MSRMLKALQQVDGAQNQGATVRPLSREDLAAFGLWHLAQPQSGDPQGIALGQKDLPQAVPTSPPPASAPSSGIDVKASVSAPWPVPPQPIPAPASSPPQSVAAAVIDCPAAAMPDAEPVVLPVPSSNCSTDDSRWTTPADAISEFAVMTGEPSLGQYPAAPSELDRLLSDAARGCQRQYRELADAVVAQLPPGRPAVLLFTQASDAEQNALLLADLSIALSRRTNTGVLLVDADLRNPSLGRLLDAEAQHSWRDVLLGTADWREIVEQTKTPRLNVLSGGSPWMAEWQSPELARIGPMLDEWRSHFELVVLKAASVAHREVGALARHSDATCLTVQLGRVSRRQVRRAAMVLRRSGAALLGSVVFDR